MAPPSSDGGDVTCDGGVARSRASWIDYLQRVGSTLLLTYLAVGVTGVDGPPQTLSKQALEAKASGAARHSPHANNMFNALSRVDSSARVRHAARGAAAEARQLRPGSGDASAAARAHAMLAAPPARPSACGCPCG